MLYQLSGRDILDMSVPISRFNKGEAGKILDEVNTSGIKVVMKNNKPAGVLLSPDRYLEVMEAVENYYLLVEASTRLEVAENGEALTHEEVLRHFNLKQEDCDTSLFRAAFGKCMRTYTLEEVKKELGLKEV